MNEHACNVVDPVIPLANPTQELGQVFAPFKVCSSRILRDANGNGRGVGFARSVVPAFSLS